MKITFDTVEDSKERAIEAIEAFFPESTNTKIEKKMKKEKAKTEKKEKKEKKEKTKSKKKSKITKAEVRKALEAHGEENGRDETREILNKYTEKLQDLDPDDYADLIADLALDDGEEEEF